MRVIAWGPELKGTDRNECRCADVGASGQSILCVHVATREQVDSFWPPERDIDLVS